MPLFAVLVVFFDKIAAIKKAHNLRLWAFCPKKVN